MEGLEKQEDLGRIDQEIFSKSVRAGKRTYFFDVKATRKNEYYLTVTESKKKFEEDGSFNFKKHKIFLYKEDFDNFVEGLQESIDFIKGAQVQTTDYEKVVSELTFEDLSPEIS
ncbi:MAG: PUR family DNA/RNA-binding protein [Marinilabiliaceae bacterium]|nr:PUR family DNA/RNA-binding protein [Marinilabiliaceae bacterium]